MILTCLIIFLIASITSVVRSNRKLGELINPRHRLRRKPPKRRSPTSIPRSFGDE
jgi:hypothetical protein